MHAVSSWRPPRRGLGGTALAATLLLHLLLLAGLPSRPPPAAPQPIVERLARLTARILAPTADVASPPPDRAAAAPGAPPRTADRPRSRRTAEAVPATTASSDPVPVAASPARAAEGPAQDGRTDTGSAPLLETAATRRAIRAAARAASPHGLPGTSPAASDQDRLAQRIGAAGHGDCGKGDYAGAGFGLLSLPFLAAAALRGECGR